MTLAGAGAIVTAGASGLGAARVRALQGEALAAELGERVRFVAADVTDAEAWATPSSARRRRRRG